MLALILAAVLGASGCGRGIAASEGPLVLERSIVLPGVSGRIDHLAVDLKRRQVFVAEVGAGALEVVDLTSGARSHRVEGLKEPQGVAYLEALDAVAVASGGDGTVRFYTAADLQPAGVVQLSGDADNARVEQKTGRLVVADGAGFAIIDPIRRTVVGEIVVGAHPEGFQIDQRKGRLVANVPDQRRIIVADLAGRRVTNSWPQRGALWNFPLALAPSGVVGVVFRGPPKLLVLDPESGEAVARVKTCGDSDDLHFDPPRGRLYVSCGSGSVETFDSRGATYRSLGQTRTAPGARTSLFVPALDRLLVAQRAGVGRDAALLVFRPQG
jgi:hypothetical protein